MKEKMTQGKIYCLISAVLIFGSYIVQRALKLVLVQNRSTVIIEAFVFSLLTAVVYFLVSKSREPFYGILMAIFGIRMLPPEISTLAEFSAEADLVYFIVKKFAVVIFAITIIKLYEQQEKPRQIKPIPIICAIIVVPFFNEIQSVVFNYLAGVSNGNLIYAYFSSFIIYSVAMLSLLFVATRCNSQGARLICDFQMLALLLNLGRRACAVIINLASSNHVSKSYYCWMLIYAFFFVAFCYLRNRRKPQQA